MGRGANNGERGGDNVEMERSRIIKGPSHVDKRDRAVQLRREMTPAELKLWHFLRTNKLDGLHFRRQQVIDGFIVDFFSYEAGLIVEVDGSVHETQREYDEGRSRIFAARGLRVLRLTNERIFNDLPSCLAEIITAARGHHG